jgi:hypothetical protein
LRIERIEVRRYEVALDPPFRAAWDPVPRDRLRETVVLVHADDGSFGTASGAPLLDADLLSGLLVGVDPRRTEVVRSICETVDFHGGRPWAVEVAVWDLVGRSLGEPLWRLLGGRSDSLVAYASTGERLATEERVARVKTWVADGIRAVKLRFQHQDWREDVEVVEAVRDAVGSGIEILVDANREAEGRPFYQLGRRVVSPKQDLLAFLRRERIELEGGPEGPDRGQDEDHGQIELPLVAARHHARGRSLMDLGQGTTGRGAYPRPAVKSMREWTMLDRNS